ncbi:unnamed protein product (macronuclear) [Paramecium tetraurelia]|uniref:Rhodanese domain-containing protein n=1 Tax=Paramecium tetraurelia TaxID=5888 RepID=A0CUK5_PARTE|nr:uncharacterized protein GSPATT00010672001 [Paramecium tetraurelia]CAK74472.1 unnamed protein product [Paramecium tetraurelia]|eukprot:XP_001441869.1 hypothetical protein (macronuclear) [Paramecium tetraurelia strain d4-2]
MIAAPKIFENHLAEKTESPDFYIQQFYIECLSTFSYYIESKGEVAVIDPLRDIHQYIELSKNRNAQIKWILETHFHADFVSGHRELANLTGATIVYGPTAVASYPIKEAKDGDGSYPRTYNGKSSCFVLVHNGKDHSVYTGDTLFLGEVGRPDLAVKVGELTVEMLASYLYDSLRNKVMKLNDDVIVYPGHGAGSSCGKSIGAGKCCTIGMQKKNNYALQDITKEEFINQALKGMPKPPQYFFHDAKLNKSGANDFSAILSEVQKALTFEEFMNYVKQGALILDTRPNIQEGVIKGAINITFMSGLVNFVGSIIKPETKLVIIGKDGEAKDSILRLLRIGYDNIFGYLDGGFETYKNNGGELATQVQIVGLEELCNINDNPNDHVFVDVRGVGELRETGFVKGAICIVLSEIEGNVDKIPKDKKLHIYCKSGWRAKIAMSILVRSGFERIMISQDGGFEDMWEKKLIERVDM